MEKQTAPNSTPKIKTSKKKKTKLSYDEKFMRSRGLYSWRGPNPTNK